jgi:hypothetical protein
MVTPHRLTEQPDQYPTCTAEGGPAKAMLVVQPWNSTSVRRQMQVRDVRWFCGNQSAYHSMINRRSGHPPPRMPASERQPEQESGWTLAPRTLENGHDG